MENVVVLPRGNWEESTPETKETKPMKLCEQKENSSAPRSLGQMVEPKKRLATAAQVDGKQKPGDGKLAEPIMFQYIAKKVTGTAKEVKRWCIGRILSIQVAEREVTVHKHTAVFDDDLRVKWKPIFLDGERREVAEAGANAAQEVVDVTRVITK